MNPAVVLRIESYAVSTTEGMAVMKDSRALLDAFADARRSWDDLVALQPDIYAGSGNIQELNLAELAHRVEAHQVAIDVLSDAVQTEPSEQVIKRSNGDRRIIIELDARPPRRGGVHARVCLRSCRSRLERTGANAPNRRSNSRRVARRAGQRDNDWSGHSRWPFLRCVTRVHLRV